MKKLSFSLMVLTWVAQSAVADPNRKPAVVLDLPRCYSIHGPIPVSTKGVGLGAMKFEVSGSLPRSSQVKTGGVLILDEKVTLDDLSAVSSSRSSSSVFGVTPAGTALTIEMQASGGRMSGAILLSEKMKQKVLKKFGGAYVAEDAEGKATQVSPANACVSAVVIRHARIT